MLIGKVKWYNLERKYGFLSAEGQDFFVHVSDIAKDGFKSLYKDDTVSFELKKDERGVRAANVLVIDGKSRGGSQAARRINRG